MNKHRKVRILITGSRDWEDYGSVKGAITEAMESLSASEAVVVTGGARGADRVAEQVAEDLGLEVEVYPADWSIGKFAGPDRNLKMVRLGADICLAFPIGLSRGTRHCMRAARNAGIIVKDVSLAMGLE